MRVLLTGASTLQVKPPEHRRSSTIKIDVPAGVRRVMEEAGWEVDWAPARPGAALREYDLVWVNVAGVLSLNSTPGGIGMLSALGQSRPTVLFFDDWKTRLTTQQSKQMLNSSERYYDKWLLTKISQHGNYVTTHPSEESARAEYECFLRNVDEATAKKVKPAPFYAQRQTMSRGEWMAALPSVKLGAERLAYGHPFAAVGVPTYSWGDLGRVYASLGWTRDFDWELLRLDPSWLAQEVVLDLAHKRREHSWPVDEPESRWGLAALGDFNSFLTEKMPDRTWPVEMVGHSSNRKVKTEADVLEFYASCAAIISPSYYHSGSGWWRSRFIYAASVNRPLATFDGEAAGLGAPYTVPTYRDIEMMSQAGRDDLAVAQRDALMPRLATRADFRDQVMALCEAALKHS